MWWMSLNYSVLVQLVLFSTGPVCRHGSEPVLKLLSLLRTENQFLKHRSWCRQDCLTNPVLVFVKLAKTNKKIKQMKPSLHWSSV